MPMRTMGRSIKYCCFLLLILTGAHAQDLALLAGATRNDHPRDTSYGWGISYAHELSPHLFASFSYQNEGHVPGHHRDGHSVQLWARTSVFSPELSIAAGVGPFHYFDTTVAEEAADGFSNAHGWGPLYSLAATWRPRSTPWYYELRVNRSETRQDLDTTQLLLGVGYRLDQDGSFTRNATTSGWKARDNEMVVAAGQTIVNSFESQSAIAKSFDYRYSFTPALRGAIGWLNEGDARLTRRGGVVAQAWFEPSFFGDRFTLGLGYGAYFAVDRYHSSRRQVQDLLSTTFSYHFTPGWVGRLTWHRIASDYDRDSDILLVGLGYRF
jgi:hypothetical protein